MNAVYEKLLRCYEIFQKKIDFCPEVALVLGSGLGNYAEQFEAEGVLNYSEFDDFPISTVSGHKGRFVFCTIRGVKTVIMQGRVHYYEGYPMTDVVLPIRLMKMMGAKALFLTNASGGISSEFRAGDFMMITDHISSLVPSPLIGANIEEWGVRFPDMSAVYDKEFCKALRKCADSLAISLKEGVYIQTSGPNFETPAEVSMCRAMGADAVGMSTTCEAMAARHMGMRVCGISCITNMASGITGQPLTHEEVKETGDRVAKHFAELVTEAIFEIHRIL